MPYDPNQLRDQDGKWSGGAGGSAPPSKPVAATLRQWAQHNLAQSQAQLAAAGPPPQDVNRPGKPYVTPKTKGEILGMAKHGFISAGPDTGSHQCVPLAKAVIPPLGPTGGWTKGPTITGPHDPNLRPGTAIGYGWDKNGNWPNHDHGNHVAIVSRVDPDGTVHIIDQWDHGDGQPHRAQERSLKPGEIGGYSVVTRKQ